METYQGLDLEAMGRRIKDMRKAQNLTVERFAEELGVSQQAVYKWQRGDMAPSVDTLIEMHFKFGADINNVLVGDGREPSLSVCISNKIRESQGFPYFIL